MILGRHTQGGEAVFVAGEEMLHGLEGDGELHEHLAAERQHHDEERKPATGIAHRNGSVGTPVDLRTLAGNEVQLEIDRPLGRAGCSGRNPAESSRHRAISFLAQTLEDLLSAIRAGCPATVARCAA